MPGADDRGRDALLASPKANKGGSSARRVTALVVLVAAAAAFLSSALAAAAPEGTMVLTARFEPRSMFKVGAGRRGPSPGEFVQTIVDPRFRGVSTTADLPLPDGTIELQGAGLSSRLPGGAKPSRETDIVIVGGTGAYSGVGGSVDLSAAGHLKQRLELSFDR